MGFINYDVGTYTDELIRRALLLCRTIIYTHTASGKKPSKTGSRGDDGAHKM